MSRDLDAKKVCYPAYLKVRSPAKAYRYTRVVVLIACVLTCIISPDLTLGILLIVFFFANYCNLWMIQVIYSAIISALKIVVSLCFTVALRWSSQDVDGHRLLLVPSARIEGRPQPFDDPARQCGQLLLAGEWNHHGARGLQLSGDLLREAYQRRVGGLQLASFSRAPQKKEHSHQRFYVV